MLANTVRYVLKLYYGPLVDRIHKNQRISADPCRRLFRIQRYRGAVGMAMQIDG